MGYGDPAGYQPLREAIAAYLGRSRGVRCDTEQVIIVAGSQQGLDLTARVLLDPGDAVWMEDPGYRGALAALTAAGARVVPVPVDDQGLDPVAGNRREAHARLVYVTPSHQFPLGVVMTVSRRLELLKWAARRGAWVLEDDYDSEYRYRARPLAALQGLDTEGRVIYIGTFSKVLFPSLRLGYLVVPLDLIDTFTTGLAHTSGQARLFEQLVLADFMNEGHFERHIRRMRGLYQERQRALVAAAERDLKGILEVAADEAGIHLIGWLPRGASDRAASRAAVAEGVYTPPLSFYCLMERRRGGLLLGYACIDEGEIDSGVRRLAKALKRISVG
jgi:GntR family transcriptional regulator/MocR family aminotransferase